MKKIPHLLLLIGTVIYFSYTLWFILGAQQKVVPVAQEEQATTYATTTTAAEEEVIDPSILKTQSGRLIKVTETNPSGQSMSTITITSSGFENNTAIVLEKNKLTNFFLADLNNDAYDELIIITTAQGSGSYGEVSIFTTLGDKAVTPVPIPAITEEDTAKGKLFEGYMGHDAFSLINKQLIREFPTYTKTDTQSNPTGPSKRVAYTLKENDGILSVTFTKATTTPQEIAPQDTTSRVSATSSSPR